MRRFCAVAAFALLASAGLIRANADDVPTTSRPSCEFGEPPISREVAPEVMVANRARFVKLCMESNGAMVYDGDTRLAHSYTPPGKLIEGNPSDFFPPALVTHRGTIWISLVVETDGLTSLTEVLKSSGSPALDDAVLRFAKSISYESPGYLDFTPVRVYLIMSIDFKS